MRILYLSDFRPLPTKQVRTEEYVADGFEALGHELIRFQIGPYRERERIGELNPDLILLNHSRDMPRHWIRALPAENPRALVVQWIFDYLRDPGLEKKWFLPRGRAWHLSFLKDRERFAHYQSLGIECHWLHQGAPPGLGFATQTDPAHMCEIAFLGNPRRHHPFRIEVLRRLVAEGFNLHIYTNPIYFRSWRRLGLPRENLFPNLHDADMAPVCASARIVLGVGCYEDEWEGFWSSRPYLTMAMGGFFVTQYVKGMEEHFENGRHLLWWHDPDECVSLVREYLDRPQERERIRREGSDHVYRHHTYRQRCGELAAICEERLERLRAGEVPPLAEPVERSPWLHPISALRRKLGGTGSS